jgi:hypothetical protein
MPHVYNIKKDDIVGAVYVGRGTKWGNPYVIGRDGTRVEVIQKYREYLARSPDLVAAMKRELKGRDLYCHCRPLRCHGEVILEIANEDGS